MSEPPHRVQDAADALSEAVGMVRVELQQLAGRRMKVEDRLVHLTRLTHALAQSTSTLARVNEALEVELRLKALERDAHARSPSLLDALGLDPSELSVEQLEEVKSLLEQLRDLTENPEGVDGEEGRGNA